ncbi:hypothetical protein F5Y06DRAFT_303488 [Hypoxylon sp. FL0890]|nr:hypothetical protein F5Y06DRAFT_303488 [Hypoxylon sp. FL0890]
MAKDGTITIPVDSKESTAASSDGDRSPNPLQSQTDGLSNTDHRAPSPSKYHIPVKPKPPKRKSKDRPGGKKKKRKTKSDVQLPPEVLSRIFSSAMDSDPICALDLLVPDWRICKRENPLLEKCLEITRVVTYTRGSDGKASRLAVNFGHGDRDHIFLPMKSLDDRLLRLNKRYYNEVVRSFFQEGTQVFHFAADTVPENITDESFLEPEGKTFPIRGRRTLDIIPFDDETTNPPKKKTPNGETYIFKILRHVVIHSPLSLMDVDARTIVGPEAQISEANLEALDIDIDFDRAAPLWLSWSQMPMLESVLLDLRIYSHDLNTRRGIVGKSEIIRQAREMGRWLRLKLLVISGLQSYSFETSYESYTAKRVEEDDEIDGEPNWIKIFMAAVRPGGKLILVDRLMDETPKLPPLRTKEA